MAVNLPSPAEIWQQVLAAAGRVGSTDLGAAAGSAAGVTPNIPGAVGGQAPYYGPGGYGPDDAAALAAGFLPGSVPNAGQHDLFGNVYLPVNDSFWGGGYVDPKSLPGSSTGVNSQLWGGPTSDSAPAWFKQMVDAVAAMPNGPEKTARIQHIMSGVTDPAHGANQHDVGYAERAFGISQ